MEREAADATLNPALLEAEAPALNTLLQEGGSEEAGEADAALAAAARPLAAPPPADVDVTRRVVARWRAFVAERKACPLLDLRQAVPDLFEQEVLKQLDPTDRAGGAAVAGGGAGLGAPARAKGVDRVPPA